MWLKWGRRRFLELKCWFVIVGGIFLIYELIFKCFLLYKFWFWVLNCCLYGEGDERKVFIIVLGMELLGERLFDVIVGIEDSEIVIWELGMWKGFWVGCVRGGNGFGNEVVEKEGWWERGNEIEGRGGECVGVEKWWIFDLFLLVREVLVNLRGKEEVEDFWGMLRILDIG